MIPIITIRSRKYSTNVSTTRNNYDNRLEHLATAAVTAVVVVVFSTVSARIRTSVCGTVVFSPVHRQSVRLVARGCVIVIARVRYDVGHFTTAPVQISNKIIVTTTTTVHPHRSTRHGYSVRNPSFEISNRFTFPPWAPCGKLFVDNLFNFNVASEQTRTGNFSKPRSLTGGRTKNVPVRVIRSSSKNVMVKLSVLEITPVFLVLLFNNIRPDFFLNYRHYLLLLINLHFQ